MSRSPMIVRTIPALRRAIDGISAKRFTTALVPTMGSLHDGHLSLVRLAKRRAPKVIVSIFVNPTQFAPTEDFGSYPRTWKADLALLAAENVDLIWNPDVKTMYPDGFATKILTEGPARVGLGDRFRPDFFTGVSTAVGKLFMQCRPDFAIFRRKGLPAIARGDANGQGSGPRRQGDRVAYRARARWARDVFAKRLFVRGRAPGRARAVPGNEGERQALARGRRYQSRHGGWGRTRGGRRIHARLFRGASRRDPAADCCGDGRPDAAFGRGQDWNNPAHRQRLGLARRNSFPELIRGRLQGSVSV